MKKLNQIKRGLLVASFLLGAAILPMACQQEEVITLPADGGFLITLQEEALDVTRSTPAELGKPLVTQFHLKVEKEGGGVIYNQLYTDQLIAASAGRYNLTATYGENVPLAWDAPYYEGTAQAEVTQGTTPVTLPCRVANALLSVKYSKPELFNQVYSQYYVSVNVENSSLQISQAEEKQSAYFRAGQPLTVTFHGTLKEGAKEVTTDLTGLLKEKLQLKDELILQAANHAKLTLAASNTVLKVEKLEIKKETIQETIPQEWLPKPKVSGFGEGTTTLQYVETNAAMPAAIAFTASTPIQDAEFTLSLEDEQFTSLNGNYKLSTLSQEQRTQLESVGIQPPYIGEKNGSFNLTHLTARLQTNAGATTSNRITFRVKANNRWSAEADAIPTYTIETLKPEFSVSIQPGNIWTKEFTVDEITKDNVVVGKGDVAKLSQQMSYQFSKDQQTWETLSEDLRKSNLQPNTTYYIRGLYRGIVEGNVTELRTYDAFQIPNSTMEEGYTVEYPKNKNPLYVFNGNWIDTRNEQTCHANGANAFYVSKSSTLPMADNGSNVAHLMTIGWGQGNTCNFGNKQGSTIYNVSAGMLCVGDYRVNEDKVYPQEASIRPTALQYTYKAAPYNNDEYLIEICMINLSNDTETIIGYAKHQSNKTVSSYQQSELLTIVYDDAKKNLPITHIKVIFKAGTNENRDYLKDKFDTEGSGSFYSNYYLKGSEFWLDSFSLIYDK